MAPSSGSDRSCGATAVTGDRPPQDPDAAAAILFPASGGGQIAGGAGSRGGARRPRWGGHPAL